MANEFFPYSYQDNSVTLKITGTTVDDQPRPDLVDSGDTCIDLTSRPTWKKVSIAVNVQVDPQTAAVVLPPDERTTRPWHAVVAVTSVMGNTRQVGWRQAERLTPTDAERFNWVGNIELIRDAVGAAVRLRAYITRETHSTGQQDRYAAEPGLRLAASEEWTVQIDPRSIPPGKCMEVKWANFRTGPQANLNAVATSLYFLDLDHDFPVLYLNEDIQDFKAILSAGGHVGVRAALRDALYDSIAQPVWTALAILAGSKKYEEDSDRPEWEQGVLKEMAPYAYSEESEEAAITHMVQDGTDPGGHRILLQRLLPAVETYIDLRKSTLRLFRETTNL